jgi:hypothetical protein
MAYFKKILEYTFSGAKEMKVVLLKCDWFDPVNGTRVDNFGMVEVKHESCYSVNNLLFTHQAQQVYYISYPQESMKNWWVVYKVNLEMDTRRYDAYVKRHDDDDDVVHVYQEEIDVHHCFTVSDGAGLTELPDPSKKRIWKSKHVIERQERHEQLNAHVAEADSNADDFW